MSSFGFFISVVGAATVTSWLFKVIDLIERPGKGRRKEKQYE